MSIPPGKEYGTLKIEATSLLREASIEPFQSRKDTLRTTLEQATDLVSLSAGTTITSGVDLLSSLFTDSDTGIAKKAIETFIRRVYRAHNILEMEVTDEGGYYTANFEFNLGGLAEPGPTRKVNILPLVYHKGRFYNVFHLLNFPFFPLPPTTSFVPSHSIR